MAYIPYEPFTYGGLTEAGKSLGRTALLHPLGWTWRFLVAGYYLRDDLMSIDPNRRSMQQRASDAASGRTTTGWYWVEIDGEILYYHPELKPQPVMVPSAPVATFAPVLVGSGEHTLLMSGYEKPSKNLNPPNNHQRNEPRGSKKGPSGLRGQPEQVCPKGYRFDFKTNACMKV